MNSIIDLFLPKKGETLAHAEAGVSDISGASDTSSVSEPSDVPNVLCSTDKPHTRFPHQHSRARSTFKPDDAEFTQFDQNQKERQQTPPVVDEVSRPNELMAPKETEQGIPRPPPATIPAKPHSVPVDILRKALPDRFNEKDPESGSKKPSIFDAFDKDHDD
ncbi:MAG: hypothetical protein ABJN14_06875 [Paracoccaceae bacterium]